MAGKVVNFAGIQVDNVGLSEAAEIVKHLIMSGGRHLVVTPNPEIIVACQTDNELKGIMNGADLRVPDGISLIVVSKILNRPLRERVSGIDLLLKLVEISARDGYRIFLLGSAPGVAEQAAQKLSVLYPELKIAGTHDGFTLDDSSLATAIRATRPDILFVGLGAGRQEKWLDRHLAELNVPVSMVIGGSLDVIAGVKKRAPVWVQNLYIEWLYRLITEPKRWKRQLALPKFLYLTLIKKVL